MVKLIIYLIVTYLLGSIPFGLLMGFLFGVDVRKHGSGNIGATNVMRTVGKVPGIIVLLLDALKAFFPVFLAKSLFPELTPGLPEVLTSFCAIMGHNFSVFLKFTGGKGVATSLGVFLALDWRIAVGGLAVFIITVAMSKYVSLGSILGTISGNVFVILFYRGNPKFYPYIIFIFLATVSVILTHRSNIQRLLNGTEKKFGQKAEVKKEDNSDKGKSDK